MHTTVGVLSAMLLAGVAICGAQEPEMTRPNGTPVVHMWAAGMPDSTKPAMGFPEPEGVRTTLLYHASRDSGIYSHHPQITYWHGMFYTMWSNHLNGEDGPGQRVYYRRGTGPEDWEPIATLFPSPDNMRDSDTSGIGHTALKWVVVEDRLYAVAGLHENIGFHHPDRPGVLNPVRTAEFPWRSRRSVGIVACEVKEDGTFGPIFAAGTRVPPPERIKYRFLAMDDRRVAPLVSALQEALYTPTGMPAWDFDEKMNTPQGVDTDRLCEPTCYEAADGRLVVLQRDESKSHRMYVGYSSDGGATWSEAVPTDIPDTPSLTTSVRLDDGTVILVGNQAAPEFDPANIYHHFVRDPLVVAVSPDGLTFERAYALRHDAPPARLRGKSAAGGFQYPGAVVVGDTLYVIYSITKEDVGLSWVPLTSLGIE